MTVNSRPAYPQEVPEPDRRSSYHHGALREELLRACLQLIETEGIGAVSLRRVARTAGVSPAAPYHHFSDRAALLAAISVRGFELVGERLRAARATADSPVSALGALVEAYVTFAREQPAYFRLMFRPELSQPQKHPDAQVAGDAAFQVLNEVMADCQRDGLIAEADIESFTLTVWALGHGLAWLCLEGQLHHRAAAGDSPQVLTRHVASLLESALSCLADDRNDHQPND